MIVHFSRLFFCPSFRSVCIFQFHAYDDVTYMICPRWISTCSFPFLTWTIPQMKLGFHNHYIGPLHLLLVHMCCCVAE